MHSLLSFLVLLVSSSTLKADAINANCGGVKNLYKWMKLSPRPEDYTLLQAHTYIRHGDRTLAYDSLCWSNMSLIGEWNCSQSVKMAPYNSLSNSLYTDQYLFHLSHLWDTELFPGTCMRGQLTARGYQMEVENGIGLRSRYVDHYRLLPADLNKALAKHKKVAKDDSSKSATDTQRIYKIRADDDRRVQHSAMSLFTGLFSMWDTNEPFEEIALWTEDKDFDIIFPNANVCPCYEDNSKAAERSPEMAARLNKFLPPLVEWLDPIIYGGMKQLSLDEQVFKVGLAYDCMTTYSCHQMELPKSVTQQLYNDLLDQNKWYWYYIYEYPTTEKGSLCTVGPLLKLLKERLQKMVARPRDATKWYLYAGHDMGPMMPLLAALKQSTRGFDKWAPYASMINIELFSDEPSAVGEPKHFVSASYEGIPLALPRPCDSASNPYSLCSLDKFIELIEPMIPDSKVCPGMNPYESVKEGGSVEEAMRQRMEQMRKLKQKQRYTRPVFS